MKKNKISSYFLFISIFTLVTIFVFIVHRSYTKLVDPVKQIQTTNLTKPLDPTINTKVLDIIKQKREFSPNDVLLPSVTPTSISTGSASITPSPIL